MANRVALVTCLCDSPLMVNAFCILRGHHATLHLLTSCLKGPFGCLCYFSTPESHSPLNYSSYQGRRRSKKSSRFFWRRGKILFSCTNTAQVQDTHRASPPPSGSGCFGQRCAHAEYSTTSSSSLPHRSHLPAVHGL